jgi:hypothetical protein
MSRVTSVSVAAFAALGVSSVALAVPYTFPTFNIGNVTLTEVLTNLNVSAVPAGPYDKYSMTVNWTPGAGDPWSNEARLRILTGGTPLVGGGTSTSGVSPISGQAPNGNPTTLTFSGDFNGVYTGGNPLSVGARQTFGGSNAFWNNVALTIDKSVPPSGPDYILDDGTAEDAVGITGTNPFDIVWLNRFPVQAGGEIIESISIAYGSPGNTSTGYNANTPVEVLLYEDANGGSPTDAVLKASVTGTTQNVNNNVFVEYDIPDTLISNTLLVGVVVRNLPGGNAFIAAIDETDPTFNNRSFAGFTTTGTTPASPLNINNLASLGANFGSIDSFGLPGNWLIRAKGRPVPEPTVLGLLGAGAVLGLRRRSH